MPRIVKALAATLAVAMALSGCSGITPEGRRQAAVRHQIEKTKKEHAKHLAKAIKEANRPLRQPVTVSEPVTTITLEPTPWDKSATASTENVAPQVIVETEATQRPTP